MRGIIVSATPNRENTLPENVHTQNNHQQTERIRISDTDSSQSVYYIVQSVVISQILYFSLLVSHFLFSLK